MQTGTDAFSALSNSIADAVQRAAHMVVAVNGNQRIASSGVLWGDGLVATADHTLRRDEDLTVVLPGNETVSAKLVGRDAGTDLALLQLATRDLPAAHFADPSSLQVGNMVLAVGRRGENGPSASLGVISALGGPWRTWRNGQIERFVRADLNLYPGSSGSALVDTDGKVIGVNTAGLTRNWSVTVPRETVDSVIAALLSHGHVSRGFLGVGLHPVQLPDGRGGVIVLSVEPAGPADKAGLLIGDVLLSIAGKAVADTDDVQTQLGPDFVNKPVTASVYRGGEIHELTILVGARPKGNR